MHELYFGEILEEFPGEMRRAAGAGRPERQRFGPGEPDQFFHRGGRQSRMDNQHFGYAADQRNRREIFYRIVGELFEEAHVYRMRRGIAEQQRIAVGRRMRCDVGADDAGRSGAVVDDDLLPPFLGQFLRKGARNDVDAAARGEGRD